MLESSLRSMGWLFETLSVPTRACTLGTSVKARRANDARVREIREDIFCSFVEWWWSEPLKWIVSFQWSAKNCEDARDARTGIAVLAFVEGFSFCPENLIHVGGKVDTCGRFDVLSVFDERLGFAAPSIWTSCICSYHGQDPTSSSVTSHLSIVLGGIGVGSGKIEKWRQERYRLAWTAEQPIHIQHRPYLKSCSSILVPGNVSYIKIS